MIDRKKVIRAVETCFDSWIDKHQNMGLDLHEVEQMKHDALALLKEREHTKPYRPEELWLCEKCDQTVGWDDILGIEDTLYNYCPNCGRIVDWDEFPWLKEGRS